MMTASRTDLWSIALWSIALTPIPALPALATPSDDPGAPQSVLPLVTITHDDTVLTESCRVVIPAGTVIPDKAGDGVIQIRTDGITVEFAPRPDGSPTSLAGAPIDNNWDTLTGVGVRIEHAENVTLRNLRVHGYKVGVLATHADGLTVESADLSDNYRQRLKSTPLREDPTDWLYPHDNDNREWVTKHGAALCIERSDNVTVRVLRVRRGQNGIILDRVNNAKIYDNDCSFLSGWGLACWRSSDNLISRNAFDFCVRGHSEGVYNRGQDSAGILFFEQCKRNIIIENSATHSGDGFFGFAGREAIGQAPRDDQSSPGTYGGFQSEERFLTYAQQGANWFKANDFSYAPAHGWEMTFSWGNYVEQNRIVDNGICGIWGGYSNQIWINRNHFEGNGTLAYGSEGGAINIEHGSDHVIGENTFINNSVAVRLWWDDDESLLALPGTPSRDDVIKGNWIHDNTIEINDDHPFTNAPLRGVTLRGVWFQDPMGTHFGENRLRHGPVNTNEHSVKVEDFEPGTEPERVPEVSPMLRGNGTRPKLFTDPIGTTHPVGARDHLRGRHNIIMGEWGPWDHESTLVRIRERTARRAVFEVFGIKPVGVLHIKGSADVDLEEIDETPFPRHARFTATVSESPTGDMPAGLGRESPTRPFGIIIPGEKNPSGLGPLMFTGMLYDIRWKARVWSWRANPLEDLDAWRAEAYGESIVRRSLDELNFDFNAQGPAETGLVTPDAAERAGITRDRFAIIADTTVWLHQGAWTIRTLSDDGIRVFVDGEIVIERWNIHGPTPDTATFAVTESRGVEILIEYFENDGWAALQVTLEPAD